MASFADEAIQGRRYVACLWLLRSARKDDLFHMSGIRS
jgi:hypothetical protein